MLPSFTTYGLNAKTEGLLTTKLNITGTITVDIIAEQLLVDCIGLCTSVHSPSVLIKTNVFHIISVVEAQISLSKAPT